MASGGAVQMLGEPSGSEQIFGTPVWKGYQYDDIFPKNAPRPDRRNEQMPHQLEVMERQLVFVQEEYQKLLKALHHEVETLKEENKSLKFALTFDGDRQMGTMYHGNSSNNDRGRTETPRKMVQPVASDKSKETSDNQVFELKNTRQELSALKFENKELRREVEFYKRLDKQKDDYQIQQLKQTSGSLRLGRSGGKESTLRWSLGPLVIQLSNGTCREPTTKECETIIGNLHRNNVNQKKELESVRADLQELLSSVDRSGDLSLSSTQTTLVGDEGGAPGTLPRIHHVPHPPTTSKPPAGSSRSAPHRVQRRGKNVDVHLTLPVLANRSTPQPPPPTTTSKPARHTASARTSSRDKMS